MWCETWWSNAWGDGCSDWAIFRCSSLHHWTVCVFRCMHMCQFGFCFLTLLCNAVCDLGNNMCQRDTGRELRECVTTSTSVSSLTAQRATRAALAVRTWLMQLLQLHEYMHCRLQVRVNGETGDHFIKFEISISKRLIDWSCLKTQQSLEVFLKNPSTINAQKAKMFIYMVRHVAHHICNKYLTHCVQNMWNPLKKTKNTHNLPFKTAFSSHLKM